MQFRPRRTSDHAATMRPRWLLKSVDSGKLAGRDRVRFARAYMRHPAETD